MRRVAIAFMSLLIVAAVWSTGCSLGESGQTQTNVEPVVGSIRQDHALKVRIDSLSWSWESETTPTNGETGAFSIEVEATIQNAGKVKLYPIFSVGSGGKVSWSQTGCDEGMIHGSQCKLRVADKNQVHLEFNSSDPGKEILFTVHAKDQWSEDYALSFTLPPPLEMPRCAEQPSDSQHSDRELTK